MNTTDLTSSKIQHNPSAEIHPEEVLIIDDDAHFIKLLTYHLKKVGYQTILNAKYPQEGIKMAEDEKPKIVILDTILPGTDGFGVCAKIRRIDGMGKAKIVIVTGDANAVDAKRAREAGADVYTLKSENFSCIVEAIRK